MFLTSRAVEMSEFIPFEKCTPFCPGFDAYVADYGSMRDLSESQAAFSHRPSCGMEGATNRTTVDGRIECPRPDLMRQFSEWKCPAGFSDPGVGNCERCGISCNHDRRPHDANGRPMGRGDMMDLLL